MVIYKNNPTTIITTNVTDTQSFLFTAQQNVCYFQFCPYFCFMNLSTHTHHHPTFPNR